MHYKNLPASAPLFTLMHHQDSQAQRNTGNNAARLVKGKGISSPLVKGIPFRDLNS
ncbi:Propanediol dehydratase reactivation factor small subunit [Salmonella enterica subsp. enterica serovar Montevideo str. S5-403]|uniref:Propanediol dehydratase reactivation factor small subunit n=1 Tax=Salmonella enterica subsp. enterica serovar Montevideo str. S5-403 TaxID=913242 RepID=G5Q4C4_SALMO|nr:Propanediol dehydratase reactivation factor small subunit [Salmonella enterica subsp. enterica serovar Montevideo str. S5-403]